MTSRWAERGFTIIEIMIVVAVVAVLGAIALPSFARDVDDAKVTVEVNAMFTELSTKQGRYKNENNAYLAIAECPTPPSRTKKSAGACQAVGSPWVALGVVPHEQTLYCTYEVYVGDSSTAPTAPAGTTVTIPTTYVATSWYMLHARCDMDNDGVIAHWVSSSFDASLQITNRGE